MPPNTRGDCRALASPCSWDTGFHTGGQTMNKRWIGKWTGGGEDFLVTSVVLVSK